MTFSKIKTYLLIGLAICSLISCGEDTGRTELSPTERSLLDSVFSDGLKEARKQADQTCISLRDSLFEMYVDSILELRLIEVDQIIND